METQKLCLSCGEIIRGRSDKKFCDDNCRSNYNYTRNTSQDLDYIRNINNTLRRNRNILKKLNVNEKTKVWKTTLTARGFNFAYHTSIYETEKRSRYYFCYEMGYLFISDAEVLLVKKRMQTGH